MDDLHRQITDLVEAEHRLRQGPMDDSTRAELTDIETRLDQIWDLMRQRDALRDVGENPDDAEIRPASEVEGYLQ